YKIDNWKEFLEANSKSVEDLINHLDGFQEDKTLIEIVNNNLKLDNESNYELIRCICEMMKDEEPAIKSMTFEQLDDNTFEITEERRDGR
ncbi:hypothetical protein KAZ01_04200, partial [Candidatus Gracilibacteria bacterium]|nr:hypothetical protein [Candidatus Gracilibacteria bacterium]